MQLPVGASITLEGEVDYSGNGLYWIGGGPYGISEMFLPIPASIACSYAVSATTEKSGVLISPASINTPDVCSENYYFRAGRIASAIAFFQEGMRWSDDPDDAAAINADAGGFWGIASYQELTPYTIPYNSHRLQQLRHRKAIELSFPSYSDITNSWRLALASLQDECRQMYASLIDDSDPVALCMPQETDLDLALDAARTALASDFDVGCEQYSFVISHPSNDVYTVKAIMGLDLMAERELDNSDAPIPAGRFSLAKSGSVNLPTTTSTGARVEGDYRSVLRLRTKFFNLSNLP